MLHIAIHPTHSYPPGINPIPSAVRPRISKHAPSRPIQHPHNHHIRIRHREHQDVVHARVVRHHRVAAVGAVVQAAGGGGEADAVDVHGGVDDVHLAGVDAAVAVGAVDGAGGVDGDAHAVDAVGDEPVGGEGGERRAAGGDGVVGEAEAAAAAVDDVVGGVLPETETVPSYRALPSTLMKRIWPPVIRPVTL